MYSQVIDCKDQNQKQDTELSDYTHIITIPQLCLG